MTILLLLISGGSALLPAPANGISLAQKTALNDMLLASGLDINSMNVVRRLFSRLKRWTIGSDHSTLTYNPIFAIGCTG